MIARLFSAATASARFSADELPSVLHGPLLQNVLVPRVVSCSMVPAIRKGDCLQLERADALQTGDIIIFRHDRLFVCHRIERVERDWLVVRGDATHGPPQRIGLRDVVGRVTAILRNGVRLNLESGVPSIRESRPMPELARSAVGMRERIRGSLRTVVRHVLDLPLVGRALPYLLTRIASVDVMEQAPLRSVAASLRRRSFRLRDLEEIRCALANCELNGRRFRLVIRIGPFYLASCSPHPWHVHIRPIAEPLALRTLFEHWRSD